MFKTILVLLLTIHVCLAWNREACQKPTRNPLEGCPKDTLLVGSTSTFKTVQSAVLSLPSNNASFTILVLPGTYTEQVNVTRPGPLTILGQTSSPGKYSQNTVNIIWHQATGTNQTGFLDNAYTSTLTVAPTLNASLTGSGPTGFPVSADTPFGNSDFRVYNVNFVNDYRPYSAGPSLAVSVSYANAGFYSCGFYSYQDTVYIGKLGNAYFHASEIAGQTDFLYGFGTAWVQSSLLTLRSCGGGITAWKGTNTTFVNKYGVYIHDSRVEKANSSLSIVGKCPLGRPWHALHRSIFANSYLDDSIQSSGYIKWGTTDERFNYNTTMAEFKTYGPGLNRTGRIVANITRLFSEKDFGPYSSLDKVFQFPFTGKGGNTAWIDRRA